jgi:hypothetical protein
MQVEKYVKDMQDELMFQRGIKVMSPVNERLEGVNLFLVSNTMLLFTSFVSVITNY